MSKEKKESANNTGSVNGKPSTIKVSTIWLIIGIVVLSIAVAILIYVLFKRTTDMNSKDIFLWFLFMLLAAAISCIFGAITSHFSQESEKNIVQEITDTFAEKADEIKNEFAVEQSDLISGDQVSILNILMDRCLKTGEKIKRIKILAHNSDSFSRFFMIYFKKKLFDNKPFKCKELNILIHNQDINESNVIINDWVSLFKNKEIDILDIRKARIPRRSFFGMIVEFEREYHSMGLIGFYKPQDEDNRNVVINPFDKCYGVFSEGNSILEVLDEYFNHYFENNNNILKKEFKPSVHTSV